MIARQSLGADHQHVLGESAADIAARQHESVDEPRTARAKIESPGPGGSESVLDEACSRRKRMVGSDGSDDDQVDLIGREIGDHQGSTRGASRQGRGSFPFVRNYVSLTNPGP